MPHLLTLHITRTLYPAIKTGLVISILMLGLLTKAQAEPKPFIIGTPAGGPFNLEDMSGFSNRLYDKILTELGYKVVFKAHPAARSLIELNAGRLDGDMMRIKGLTDKYPNIVIVPESVFKYSFSAFSASKTIKQIPLGAYKGYSVGYVTGWKYYENFTQGFKNIDVSVNGDTLFKKLKHGRVDVALYGRLQGIYDVHKLGTEDIFVIHPPIKQIDMYFYMHNKHADLSVAFSQKLKVLKQNGYYKKLLKEYE